VGTPLGGRLAVASLDRLFCGGGGQDREIAGTGQHREEALNRLQADRLHHQQQHMLRPDECLGLDSDAVAGGSGGRYVGKQQFSPPVTSGTVFGGVPVLSDEQSDESLLGNPSPTPCTATCHLGPPAGASTRTRADKLPGQNAMDG
jgi:hypothetical protein